MQSGKIVKKKWDQMAAIAAIESKFPNKFDFNGYEFKTVDTEHEFICKDHGVFKSSLYRILKAKNPCPACAGNRKTTWIDVIEKSKIVHGERYDYSKLNFIDMRKPITVICKIHGEFDQMPRDHLSGNGCQKCHRDKCSITVNKFLLDSISKHGDDYDYSVAITQYVNTSSFLDIKCKKHGFFNQKANDHRKGSGCPTCKSSKGERKIREYLISKNIKFETQKTFDGLKNKSKLRFDFYLPEYNAVIEYHGPQHYGPTRFISQDKVNAIKETDKKKKDFALSVGMTYIEIPHYEEDHYSIISCVLKL